MANPKIDEFGKPYRFQKGNTASKGPHTRWIDAEKAKNLVSERVRQVFQSKMRSKVEEIAFSHALTAALHAIDEAKSVS